MATKVCPDCRMTIDEEASVCPYCHRQFDLTIININKMLKTGIGCCFLASQSFALGSAKKPRVSGPRSSVF